MVGLSTPPLKCLLSQDRLLQIILQLTCHYQRFMSGDLPYNTGSHDQSMYLVVSIHSRKSQ